MEVNKSASNHKDVKQLMGVKPYVTLARKEAFRDSGSIQGSPRDVEASHQHQPTDLSNCGSLQKALRDDIVQGRNDSAQAQAQKHS